MSVRAPEDHPDVPVVSVVLVVVASVDDAAALAPLGAPDAEIHPVLVATGPDPMLVDEALDDLGALAGRILLVDRVDAGPVAEMTQLLPRLDDLLASDRPAAVVVRGGSTTALAAAQASAWRGVPLVPVAVPHGSVVEAANQAAIVELAVWQSEQLPDGDVARAARRRLDDLPAARLVPVPSNRPPGLSA